MVNVRALRSEEETMTEPRPLGTDPTAPQLPDAEEMRDALQSFEAGLAERTKVPPSKLSELMEWPEERLRSESKAVSRVLKRFAEAVVDSLESPQNSDRFLHELDLRSISRDHDWRAIFSKIRDQEAGYDGYKRAVLIKYLQYLSFRKRLIEYVAASRRGLEETEEYSDITLFALRLEAQMQDASPSRRRAADPNFARLPLGESVDLIVSRDEEVNIMLAAHVFRLAGTEPPALTDQHGVTYVLKEGRNLVGRHPEGDVVVDPNYTDVSRAHVIIEWCGPGLIRLIDFSSRGTYVHRDALKRPDGRKSQSRPGAL